MSAEQEEGNSEQDTSPGQSRHSALIDLLAIFIPFGVLLSAQEVLNNELISTLGRLALIGLTLWLIHLRGGGWARLGVARRTGIGKTILLGIGVAFIGIVIGTTVDQLLRGVPGLASTGPDLSRYADIEGNLPLLLGHLLVVWTTVAFGEELVWRAFLMNRLECLLGHGRSPTTMIMLIGAGMFGSAHFYQGLIGMMVAGVLGLTYMIVYRRLGRNLWVVIFAHGLTDTLSMITLYSGRL